MNIVELFQKNAEKDPCRTAFIFKDEKITFAKLKDKSLRLAGAFADLGVRGGDKVAFFMPNIPEYIYAYLAVWIIGATAVPLDFMLTEEELSSCLAHSEAKLLLARPKPNISFTALGSKLPALKAVISTTADTQDALYFNDLLNSKEYTGPCRKSPFDKDCAIIFYTSGTTGRPKGVLVNYRQLLAPPESMDFFVGGIKPDDLALCALPFSHIGGLIYIQNCVVHGLGFVLMERFSPLEFLRSIQSYKVTCFWIVPSMYYAFLQLKEFESFDLASLRWIVTFGASSSPEALRRFHQYCPKAHLLNGWGMTETNAPTVVLPIGSDKIESVGRSIPWAEVKIFGDDDKEAPAGRVGEIVVRGWVVSDGYFKDAQLTAEALRGGWFHTGDLGRFDQQGFLYIVGRKKEMIKVAGEIVFEPEVEQAILRHPDVAEAAVIGVPDKLRTEVPKAFVVAKGKKPLAQEDLRHFLKNHLAHFKIPHYFEFVDDLPKNRAGKIDKEKLRGQPPISASAQ